MVDASNLDEEALPAVPESSIEQAARRVMDADHEVFWLALQSAARSLAERGDHRMIGPFLDLSGRSLQRPLKIGLYGNMANQAYINARALRRLGYDVEVIIDDHSDRHHLSQIYWEETEMEVRPQCDPTCPDGWRDPDFVRVINYDPESQARYQDRFSAVGEVIDMYKAHTGKSLPRDKALLLAQRMGHWEYVKSMNDYDAVQLSMWPIGLGAFCPKPYVVHPLGGDLYITCFEEDVQGLLFRSSLRGASHIAVAEIDYPQYLDRIDTAVPRSFVPLIVDTDVYDEGCDDELRSQWQEKLGGSVFLLSVCRQSWEWKGSDRLIKAFAEFHRTEGPEWRLLLQGWGDDVERSRDLVSSLGIDKVTEWLPMCSKPLLRRRQRAADVVSDQFVMDGYGTSVLESMAAGRPVIINPIPEEEAKHFRTGRPPFVGARTEDEILLALRRLADAAVRAEIGQKSRRWVEEEHGYRDNAARYMSLFEQACRYQVALGPRKTC